MKVLITGGTSGLGLAAARRLVTHGHDVTLHGRDPTKGAKVAGEIGAQFLAADLGSLADVRRLADSIDAIDLLINNAAIPHWGMPQREETKDGFERIFATNYLAHYLLTRLLLERLRGGRVVNVGAMQMGARLDFGDLQLVNGWEGMRAVTQAKLGLMCMTRSLAKRSEETGVVATILDPGLVNTPYQAKSSMVFKIILKVMGQPPEKVAETYLRLATATEVNGRFYKGEKEIAFQGEAADDQVCERLWTTSAELVGV